VLGERLEAQLRALRDTHDLSDEAADGVRQLLGDLVGIDTWTEDSESSEDGAPPALAALPRSSEPSPPALRELLGRGGTAEVWRAWDPTLDREVACKVLTTARALEPAAVARFFEEAGATARLQHPGIVAVHAMGTLPDGRPYFTMQEVRGRPLSELLRDGDRSDPLRRRRLCELLLRAAEVLAYAHDRGVLHRDFKPPNVMVGDFGEVRVIDWGLLKRLDGEGPGSRSGTPAFMAPEQARGEALTPAADVYALGASLFALLTGAPPHAGRSIQDRAVAEEPPPPDGPEALVELCRAAMSPAPTRRPGDAATFADALRQWLDGARAREQALTLVQSAEALRPRIAALWSEVDALTRAAEERREGVAAAAPLEEKRPLWSLEDRAREAARTARLSEVERLQRLRAALEQSPGLPEARERLAEHYRRAHGRALARGDADAAAEAESLVRAYDDGQHAAWLRGDGALTLHTDAPARVTLQRFEERDHRLVAGSPRALGETPLDDLPLPMGSYLLTLEAEGRSPTRYPVSISRQHRWDGAPPGATEPSPVHLPRADALGPDDVYVPAGWYRSGGVERIQQAILPPRRVWLDGFVIRRFPVTNEGYIAFLDDLVTQGLEEAALRYAPRDDAVEGTLGAMFYGRGDDGRFFLQPDSDGDLWDPRWPVLHMDYAGAIAYAAWEAARTGLDWRLPTELEWEKAARGVDGRVHPWGEHFDPLFCNMRHSTPGGPLPADVGRFPADESPYGVRGMAGNAIDWCADPYRPEGPELDASGRPRPPPPCDDTTIRVGRGGAWSFNARACRTDYRLIMKPGVRRSSQGFRLCRGAGPRQAEA